MFEPGSLLVTKVTGAYAVVLADHQDGTVDVRMASDIENKTTGYTKYTFYKVELETVEAHLRRELAEMELRQELLTSARKRQAAKELEENPAQLSKLNVN